MKVAFHTLGCKVNHYETQAMMALFAAAGDEVVAFDTPADAYIVNTCTVTQVSDKKSRQALSRAHRLRPNAAIIAVGCLGQTGAAELRALGFVDLILGTEGRKEIVAHTRQLVESGKWKVESCGTFSPKTLLFKTAEQFFPSLSTFNFPLSTEFEDLSAVRDSRTRATLKIQDGCDNYCAYCVIPYARGKPRSRSVESCERELRGLADNGYREVVLTGIQLVAYGKDLPGAPDLCDIIALAADIPGLHRVRLGSLAPQFITERFVNVCRASPNLCPQFHLSLQSGCDTVLGRMNRRYATDDYRKAAERLRKAMPNCAITTDLIAGFPGETEAEHKATCAFIREMGLARVHVFPYSKRPGTAAADMPGHLPKATKERRARELAAIGKELEENFVQAQLGKEVTVLIEEAGCGYTPNYVRVRVPGAAEGELVTGKLTAREGSGQTALLSS